MGSQTQTIVCDILSFEFKRAHGIYSEEFLSSFWELRLWNQSFVNSDKFARITGFDTVSKFYKKTTKHVPINVFTKYMAYYIVSRNPVGSLNEGNQLHCTKQGIRAK